MLSADNYGVFDKVFHHLVFWHPSVQRVLGDVENELYGSSFNDIRVSRPVFVAGLPRSGTTLLLEILYGSSEFSTFTYRHMPMVMAPVIWNKISSLFAKKAQRQERAHGDGMYVSFDSPEAFEEIIWLNYLEDKIVQEDSLSCLVSSDLTDEFLQAFRVTIKKLLFVDQQLDAPIDGSMKKKRYLSKNNANISRLPVVSEIFRDSIILVPFRRPDLHAMSFYNQHTKFLSEHESASFSKNYMKWIGHYDFGMNFKPINFENSDAYYLSPYKVTPDYILEYWMWAYRACLEQKAPNTYFFCFDDLLENPKQKLKTLADLTGVQDVESIIARATGIRAPTTKNDRSQFKCDENLLNAFALYEELRKIAV